MKIWEFVPIQFMGLWVGEATFFLRQKFFTKLQKSTKLTARFYRLASFKLSRKTTKKVDF